MDKYVCGECLPDECIRQFIAQNAVSRTCSYCARESGNSIAADVSKVAEFIEAGLKSEFGDAVEHLPWESREGGWQGTTWYTHELLRDEVDLEIESAELFDDLVGFLPDIDWCDYDPFDLSENKKLAIDWQSFSQLVKHRMRYVFFRVPSHFDDTQLLRERREPYDVLYRIGDFVNELGLRRIMPPGSDFFRARVHRSQRFSDAASLGPHMSTGAKYANRFSPAGIAMFYGALDVDTAIAEVYDCPERPSEIASIGRFENTRALHVIDLNNLPPYPSIFNGQTQDQRAPLRFLKEFVRDCTESIVKDGREHIEYVPTQVVTEFFRYIFTDADETPCDGLLYPSSRRDGGVCSVIFCSGEDCTQDRQPLKIWGGTREGLLSLDTRSVVCRNLP